MQILRKSLTNVFLNIIVVFVVSLINFSSMYLENKKIKNITLSNILILLFSFLLHLCIVIVHFYFNTKPFVLKYILLIITSFYLCLSVLYILAKQNPEDSKFAQKFNIRKAPVDKIKLHVMLGLIICSSSIIFYHFIILSSIEQK